MSINLQPVTLAEKPLLATLMQLYLYDSSDYTGEVVNVHGQFEYHYFDNYWTEEGRFPFLIRHDGALVGLALVRVLEFGKDPLYQMAEFFIMRQYRQAGIGRQAATAVFDRYPGRWEVQQHERNTSGQAFWRRVIGDYTRGNYREVFRQSDDQSGPVQLFNSPQELSGPGH